MENENRIIWCSWCKSEIKLNEPYHIDSDGQVLCDYCYQEAQREKLLDDE